MVSQCRKFATDLRVRATKGSNTVGARFGMNFRTKLTVPRTERSSLIVVGVFKSIMALIRSSPLRIPSGTKHVQGTELPLVRSEL